MEKIPTHEDFVKDRNRILSTMMRLAKESIAKAENRYRNGSDSGASASLREAFVIIKTAMDWLEEKA